MSQILTEALLTGQVMILRKTANRKFYSKTRNIRVEKTARRELHLRIALSVSVDVCALPLFRNIISLSHSILPKVYNILSKHQLCGGLIMMLERAAYFGENFVWIFLVLPWKGHKNFGRDLASHEIDCSPLDLIIDFGPSLVHFLIGHWLEGRFGVIGLVGESLLLGATEKLFRLDGALNAVRFAWRCGWSRCEVEDLFGRRFGLWEGNTDHERLVWFNGREWAC